MVEEAIPHDLTISRTARFVLNCDMAGFLGVFRSLVREKRERTSLNKGRSRGDLNVTITVKVDQRLVSKRSREPTQGHRG